MDKTERFISNPSFEELTFHYQYHISKVSIYLYNAWNMMLKL